MFSRVSKAVVIILFCIILTTVLGCDEEERYKTMAFFFDGIPPLKSEDVNDVNSPDNSRRQLQKGAESAWIIHEPSKVCANCHDMTKKPRWATPEFMKEPLQLCYDCHPGSNYSGSVDYVHGPVAVGDCMRCHNPHRSKQKHLLKLPVPDVCHQCHEKADIESIADHSGKLLSECLECHVGHSSSSRGLLKKDWNADPNANPNEDPGSGVGDELLMLLRDNI
ncbi:MAG: cytochrome c3 family protein [Planctomycetota bacterium]